MFLRGILKALCMSVASCFVGVSAYAFKDSDTIRRIYQDAYIASQDDFHGAPLARMFFDLLKQQPLTSALEQVHFRFPDSHFSYVDAMGKKMRALHPRMYLGIKKPCSSHAALEIFELAGQDCLLFIDPRIPPPIGFLPFDGDLTNGLPQETKPTIISSDLQQLRIRIPMMRGSLLAEELAVLEAIKSRRAKKIIFDLRGNGGGSDELPIRIAQLLRPKSWADRQSWHGVRLHSHFARVGFVETLRDIVKTYPEGGFEQLLEKFEQELEDRKDEEKFISIDDFSKHLVADKDDLVIPDQIIFIVDRNCASACEILVAIFKNDPNVTLVGSHTAGRFWFGNMGTFTLPESKITLRLGSFGNVFKVTSKEMIGFAPDVFARNSSDVEKLLKLRLSQ